MRRRVIVTGAAGQLALAIARAFERDTDVRALARADLDIRDDGAVREAIEAHRPSVVVNCAAFNDVDGAESDPVAALEVNAFAVRGLARAAAGAGAMLVHYSSDFVFDGATARPYTEEDRPNPQGVYAASKLLGEWFALEASRAYVLRVESLFGAPAVGGTRKGSLAGLVDGIFERREVPVFVDRTVSPSYVFDVADATRRLVESGSPFGLYHCVNAGTCSWHDIATEIARLLDRPARLKPITLESAPMRARRPRYSALDCPRLRAAGIDMPTWQEALQRYLRQDVDSRSAEWRSRR